MLSLQKFIFLSYSEMHSFQKIKLLIIVCACMMSVSVRGGYIYQVGGGGLQRGFFCFFFLFNRLNTDSKDLHCWACTANALLFEPSLLAKINTLKQTQEWEG